MNRLFKLIALGLAAVTAMPMAALAYFPEDFGAGPAIRSPSRVMNDADDTDSTFQNNTTTNDSNSLLADDTLTSPANTGDSNFLAPFIGVPSNNSNSLGGAFDIAAFRAHPCFNAVGAEQEFCLQSLGITSDFEEMAGSNALGQSIIQYMLNQRCEGLNSNDRADCLTENTTLLPQLMTQLDMEDDFTETETGALLTGDIDDDTMQTDRDIRMNREQRSARLWELCRGHELSQAGCYQQFIRAVTDESVDMNEIEDLFGNTAATTPSRTTTPNSSNTNDMLNDTTSNTPRARQNNNVLSDTAEDDAFPADPDERAQWLWDLCADMGTGQSMCYRTHFRTATNWTDDAAFLKEFIGG